MCLSVKQLAFFAALQVAHALGRVHSPTRRNDYHMARRDGGLLGRRAILFLAQRQGKIVAKGGRGYPENFVTKSKIPLAPTSRKLAKVVPNWDAGHSLRS